MDFKAVYQTLKELFPQMDIRLLKAVAIEHSKDPDAAVEYILTVVLPCTGDKPTDPTSIVENEVHTSEGSNASSPMLGSIAGGGAIASSLLNDGHNLDDDSLASSFYDANDSDKLSGVPKSVSASLKIYEETCHESRQDERSGVSAGMGVCSKTLGDHDGVSFAPLQDRVSDLHADMAADGLLPSVSVEDGEANVSLSGGENTQQDCSNGPSSSNPELALASDSIMEQPSVNCNTVECGASTDCDVKDQMPNAWNSHPDAESDSNFCYANNQEVNSFFDSEFTRERPEIDANGAENETVLSTIVTRSGQICRVNLLEDIIEEAKNYKVTVFSAIESVVMLMEEVELKENEAQQAKVASANGGLDILEKVEEIKKMLIHAKEANDMHAGEVYGEKSILATEVRELQARLLGLSDEKDKSLLMLDEMRESLEDRLAVAEEQRRAAEKEMCDKQVIAQGALAEQELLMDKVVQDSKLLQQEAEENAKLRDFLVEKGQLVDVLQGEISVICQDVKLLKENFDNRVSLSKSLSLEQTSYRLASSNSSVKSSASLKSTTSLNSTVSSKNTHSVKSTASDVSDQSTDQIKLPESPGSMNQELSGEWQTGRSEVGEEYVGHKATAGKPVSDDDWELCDI